jgi:hypothetical protein
MLADAHLAAGQVELEVVERQTAGSRALRDRRSTERTRHQLAGRNGLTT